MTEILLVALIILMIFVIILLGITIYLLSRNKLSVNEVNSTVFKAVSDVWNASGLAENIGKITTYAQEIRGDYRKLDEMLRVPKERADLGEIALEQILSDQLPPDMFGIRKKILDGKVPDAHINSTVGTICIDSKFPLDNYRNMCEIENVDERERFRQTFIRDVKGHLQKVAIDYVAPDRGTAEFAFVYIQSESVYYFLVTEAYDLLREYTRKGVQVVSPLTLSHKIEIIRASVHAKRLSEQAQKVNNQLNRLEKAFRQLDIKWSLFFGHFANAQKQAVGDLDLAYKKLRSEFDDIFRGTTSE